MLQDSLLYTKHFFFLKKSNEYMKRIATIHSKADKDVRPELYDGWLDSLIEAVKEYDPEFDSDVEPAWRIALLWHWRYNLVRCPRAHTSYSSDD